MRKKKNSFFAFCFSLIPGACHMYLGFMKQGLSIMFLLVTNIVIAAILGIGVLAVFIPILWFYAFFDAHNKRSLNDEEFNKLEDRFLFYGVNEDEVMALFKGKLRPIIAGVLIFLGFYILYQNIMRFLVNLFPFDFFSNFYYNVLSKMPQVVIAGVIIYIGFRLIAGKKQELLTDARQEDTYNKKERYEVNYNEAFKKDSKVNIYYDLDKQVEETVSSYEIENEYNKEPLSNEVVNEPKVSVSSVEMEEQNTPIIISNEIGEQNE